MRILALILSLVCLSAFAEITPEQFKKTKELAEKGDAIAQYNLGVCYRDGNGVSKDSVEAVKWFRKAADQGDAEAQNNLGDCYYDGEGVLKDPVEAVKWYKKSAEQGNDGAQFSLGICYAEGEGVMKDLIEAYAYYNLSGITWELGRRREKLEKEMTPSQIEAGQKRSLELQAKIDSRKASKEKKWWELIESKDIYIYIIGLILVLGIIITNVEKEKRLNTFIGFLFILLLGILIYFDVLDGDEVMSVIRALHFASK